MARAAGLIAVAVLPALAGITGDSYLHPALLAHGFRMAAVIAAVFCAAGGVLAALTIRNPISGGVRRVEAERVVLRAGGPAPALIPERLTWRPYRPPSTPDQEGRS